MDASAPTIPIASLRDGQKGTVSQLLGDTVEVSRLSAMGVCTGSEITCLRSGVPCIVQLGSTQLCLRPAGKLQIRVSLVADRQGIGHRQTHP